MRVAVFLVGTFAVRLDSARPVAGITVGGRALGPSLSFPRLLSLPIKISGTIVLFGAAVWSIGRFAQRREFKPLPAGQRCRSPPARH